MATGTNTANQAKNKSVQKKEEKSTLYHKDGVIFVDMFRAPDAKYLQTFAKHVLPKGVSLICSNCGKEMTSYSEQYRCHYCEQCLRLYPNRSYDLKLKADKEALQEWTENIRPIVPSNKPKESIKVKVPGCSLAPADVVKAGGFKELTNLWD